MKLPATYYDVLTNRDPILVDYVLREIGDIPVENGPFSSTDDYSKYFEEYIADIVRANSYDMELRLRSMGITDPIEVSSFIHEYRSSTEFKSLLYSKHSDYLALTNFELFGKKSFHINSNLVEYLYQTSLDIDSKFLKLPFESCLFVLDSKIAIDSFYDIGSSATSIDFSTPISVFAQSLPSSEGDRKIIFACWHANSKKSYSFVKREVLVKSGWNIDKSLKTDWGNIYKESNEENIAGGMVGIESDDKKFYEEGMGFFRIIINSILYLSSNDPDVIDKLSPHKEIKEKLVSLKSKSKIRKIIRKLENVSTLNYAEVGENLPPIIVEKRTDIRGGDYENKGIALGKRFIVRGHWRNQVCGSNNEERKIIWIKPYYKGPEMADLINKSYVVK